MLSGNKFSGTIPNSVANIRGIRILDLSGNELSGSIPSDIFNLPELDFLNLAQNLLSDEFPASVQGRLYNLNHFLGTLERDKFPKIWNVLRLKYKNLVRNFYHYIHLDHDLLWINPNSVISEDLIYHQIDTYLNAKWIKLTNVIYNDLHWPYGVHERLKQRIENERNLD